MRIFNDVCELNLSGPTCLTIGNMDGMHRGHLALIHKLSLIANQFENPKAEAGVLIFDPHPRAILRPEQPLELLSTPQERLAEAAKVGATFGIIQPFTSATANLRAVEFMKLMKKHLGLVTLVVGPDFALGRGRSGNIERLADIGREIGYDLVVLPQLEWKSRPVRSSQIRQLLKEGAVEKAAILLGRSYFVTGTVIHGDKRGRTIGVPTANLTLPQERLQPLDGVYATRCSIVEPPPGQLLHFPPNHSFASVTNIGVRPTVDGKMHRFETHLLDYSQEGDSNSLYGATLRVEFVARIRGERRFEGIDALVAQINLDIQQARTLL